MSRADLDERAFGIAEAPHLHEPFARHARLLRGAIDWSRAEKAHGEAVERRRATIRRALEDGYSPAQVAQILGLSARRVREIGKEGSQ